MCCATTIEQDDLSSKTLVRTPMKLPNAGQEHRWTSAFGSSGSFHLSQLISANPNLYVVVADGSESAQRITAELEFFAPHLDVFRFPDHEVLPYDYFSPQSDLISDRLSVLRELPSRRQGVLVVTVRAIMQRLPPRSYVDSLSLKLAVGDIWNPDEQRLLLVRAGYTEVPQVYEHGEYAVRGSVFDLFALGSQEPVRIDLFDNQVESLRIFDPDSQRTIRKIETIDLLPAREYPLDDDAIARFRNNWHNTFDTDVRRAAIYQSISDGIHPDGVECYMPMFFEETGTLFDYLECEPVYVFEDKIHDAVEQFWSEVTERYEALRHNIERPLLPPETLYFRTNEIFAKWRPCRRIHLLHSEDTVARAMRLDAKQLPDVEVQHRRSDPIERLRNFLANVAGRVLLTADTPGRQQHLLDVLRRTNIRPQTYDHLDDFLADDAQFGITVANVERGFWIDDLALITETQIFGSQSETLRKRVRRTAVDPDLVIRNLTELHEGAPVVHVDHGIGRYLGLETLTIDGQITEFVALEYADNDKLYVPVASLDLISRYTGADAENAPLHKLGADAWDKAKRRAAQKVHDVAAELLDIYSRRELHGGNALPQATEDFQRFCDQCEFELTEDQDSAVEAIMNDLNESRASDRLVCGDVGFGKTEVAMRAAFHAMHSGKQVVVLVPTTVLAQQHYDTFSDRFANWPFFIEVLSRFRTASETRTAVKKLEAGEIDVIIATHKVLHLNPNYRNLGLLIIDEEHRFGVRDKERIRNLRAHIDTLTLTATPIPRTLNLAMGSLRELSIIATPPARRLSVKTFVVPYNRTLVQDAIQRELIRGGQVFFVHNAVQTIYRIADEIRRLVPDARLGIGHGQMPKRELESVMSDFYHHRCNVLVCTTIIESGIDVPLANTIIIDRADKFGLAQLHQLRGRVGRSHRQAFAYLLTPPEEVMTVHAKKRLDAIESAGELGSGFTLAVHDMEIRGAGELLGKEQSGEIESIGFTLYSEMLQRTVNALRAGVPANIEQPLQLVHEINFNVPIFIPSDYLPDVHQRLVMYKRISSTNTLFELDQLQAECVDRFGSIPEQTENLFRTTRIKLSARSIGIGKMRIGPKSGRIEFETTDQVDVQRLIDLIEKQPNTYRVSGQDRLLISRDLEEPEDRFVFAEKLIRQLQPNKQTWTAAES